MLCAIAQLPRVFTLAVPSASATPCRLLARVGAAVVPHLESTLEVLDADEPAGEIERHADCVEAQDVGVGALLAVDQPAAGHLADLGLLERPQRLEGVAAPRTEPARLDFAKRQCAAVVRDDVKLSPPRAVVALDDLETSANEVLGGQLLAEPAKLVAAVLAHAG